MADMIDFRCKFCDARNTIPMSRWIRGLRMNKPPRFCNHQCRSLFVKSPLFKTAHGLTWMQWIEFKREQEHKFWRERILEKHPVTALREMSPEKQEEMRKLYQRAL